MLEIRGNRIHARNASQGQQLQAFIVHATSVGRDVKASTGGVVHLYDSNGKLALRAVMTPSPEPFGDGNHRTVALVTLHAMEPRPAERSDVLRKLFALSPAEQRVAAHLLGGDDLKEAAEKMRLSSETLRFHVKRLLAKTGTRKQAELIRLMQSLPGQYMPSE